MGGTSLGHALGSGLVNAELGGAQQYFQSLVFR